MIGRRLFSQGWGYGLSHQIVDEIFELSGAGVRSRADAYYRVVTAIEMGEMRDIKAEGVRRVSACVIDAAEKKAAAKRAPSDRRLFEFARTGGEAGLHYEGRGESALRRRLLSPDGAETHRGADRGGTLRQKADYSVYAVHGAPFAEPALDDWRPERFKYIRPPRPGEPEYVSRTRVLAEWLESMRRKACASA